MATNETTRKMRLQEKHCIKLKMQKNMHSIILGTVYSQCPKYCFRKCNETFYLPEMKAFYYLSIQFINKHKPATKSTVSQNYQNY